MFKNDGDGLSIDLKGERTAGHTSNGHGRDDGRASGRLKSA